MITNLQVLYSCYPSGTQGMRPSGTFSAIMTYLTGREELGLRTALFYCGNLMSNAFGGLLAAGILNGMGGKLGQAAWR